MAQPGTRAWFEALLLRFLDPLRECFSPDGARLELGGSGANYGSAAIGLEGYSRLLWALGAYWHGGGRTPGLEALYRRGLAAGTDPQNPEYWGAPGDYDQCFVEMSGIAWAILAAPEVYWEPLSTAEKYRVAAWLNTINTHKVPRSNWLFFRVMANLALRAAAMPYDAAGMEQALETLESFALGDGWYADGSGGRADYYNPWAMQDLGLIYSMFAGPEDVERAQRFRTRAVQFGRQFADWFDTDGAALPYGRSLTYRFAQCAFWSACVLAGVEPLPLAQMKGLIVRNLQWWLARPVLDRCGVLTVGYCYPQMFMSEIYNSPCSPYWAMKAFFVMALPANHPFWSVQAAPMLPLASVRLLPNAGMLLQRLPDGQVNAYPDCTGELHEMGQMRQKYSKFVYSTRFGFSAERSAETPELAAPDSMLAFVVGGRVFVRGTLAEACIEGETVFSRWMPCPGVEVETRLSLCPGGHVRHHKIKSAVECETFDCGFAIDQFGAGFAKHIGPGCAEAHTATDGCRVLGDGEPTVLCAAPGTSLYHVNTVIPALHRLIHAGETLCETTVLAEGGGGNSLR